MKFKMPVYQGPDFSAPLFQTCPDAVTMTVTKDYVAPENFHATTIFPEYYKIGGQWTLLQQSRMDGVVVLQDGGRMEVKEFRRLNVGDRVFVGRTEDGSEGILVHAAGFHQGEADAETFAFRTGRSRETSYSRDYDRLYELLKYEKDHGYIVWVLGPAVVFDWDSKQALISLIENGYVDVILAGNALATKNIQDSIVSACVRTGVPMVLAGSIRDDGPLPEVVADVYEAQNAMRRYAKQATTVICLATQLHSIATGNMTPAYQVLDGVVRPVFIYSVDVSEFAVNKLKDRGSLEVTSIVTNIQDFLVHIQHKLV